jgi:hypothetical protein
VTPCSSVEFHQLRNVLHPSSGSKSKPLLAWLVYSLSLKMDVVLSRFRGGYRRGFGLDLGFIDHVNTRLIITLYRSLRHTD